MHTPITTLKNAAKDSEATTVVDVVKRLFNLHGRERDSTSQAHQNVSGKEKSSPDVSRPFTPRGLDGISHPLSYGHNRRHMSLHIIDNCDGACRPSSGDPSSRLHTDFRSVCLVSGSASGAYMNRSRRHRSACFVGVLGVILLGLLMLREVLVIKHSPGFNRRIGGHYWEYAYDQRLSPHNKNPDGEESLEKFSSPHLRCSRLHTQSERG